MTKREIAAVLEEMAFLLELKGENPFKVKAYSAGARVIESLPEEPSVLVQKGILRNVKGIGEGLAGVVTELVTAGRSTAHQEMKASFPAGVMEMAGVPGLGPKKIKALYENLGVGSVGELEYACIENRLVGLPGFGQKTQEKILAGIRRFKRHQGFHLFANVVGEADCILEAVRKAPGVLCADLAGEIRRRLEVIQRIALVVAGPQPQALAEALQSIPDVTQVERHPETHTITARSPQGLPVSITLSDSAGYGWELLSATGSVEHVEAVKQSLTAHRGSQKGESEELIYAAAGLSYVPPELREGHGEIAQAAHGRLPVLIEAGQVQGIFHNHTVWSDGSATLEQMVGAARSLGYRYIGISDHSQAAFYANGLKEDRVKAQHAEIDIVQKKFPDVRIFKGIEADILADGAMDYPDAVLATFDFVIASVHSRFNLSEEDQTNRICRALANPYVTMLGHATGRLLLSRDAYRVDMKKVLDAAAAHNKIVEINANPHRLDLDWRLCGYAKERGVQFSINPDAHSTEGLADVPFGVNVARKGGVTAADVVNTLPVEVVASRLQAIHSKALS
ncbi:MAG: DNA polymerase/3'-5' exonuclease PolX [Nitrospirae bacterium]|nr:MAG: DNA polymerase/3'-5' exonuclease PolX [Nitrospirota bacterium]